MGVYRIAQAGVSAVVGAAYANHAPVNWTDVIRTGKGAVIGACAFYLLVFLWRLSVVIPWLTKDSPDEELSPDAAALHRHASALEEHTTAIERQGVEMRMRDSLQHALKRQD